MDSFRRNTGYIEMGAYINVPARKVELNDGCLVESAVADTKIPMIVGAVTVASAFDVPSSPRSQSGGSRQDNIDGYLNRPSVLHGRAWYEASTSDFEDEYGNPYTRIGYKGNDCTRNVIQPSPTAAHGWIPNGKLDDGSAARVMGASDLLRSHHIDTEWVRGFAKPEHVLVNGKQVTFDEYAAIVAMSTRERYLRRPGLDKMVFDPSELIVMERAMLTPHRVNDFLADQNARNMLARIDEITRVYNRLIGPRGDPKLPPELDSQNPDDIRRYFEFVLPTLMGRNIAKLHDIDGFHKYLYPGNLSALGGIVDLDSMRAPQLGFGDHRPSVAQQRRDIDYQFDHNNKLYKIDYPNTVTAVFNHIEDYFYPDSTDAPKLAAYEDSLLDAYLTTRKSADQRIVAEIASWWFEAPQTSLTQIVRKLIQADIEANVADGVFSLKATHVSGRQFQVGPSVRLADPKLYNQMTVADLASATTYEAYTLADFGLPADLHPRRLKDQKNDLMRLNQRVFGQLLEAAMGAGSLQTSTAHELQLQPA
jgi:hypothetical protein